MSAYRCYPIDCAGSIAGPSQIVDCINDAAAILKARAILLGQPLEIWLGIRRVYRTPRPAQA
jgi:hypothetical protein